MCENRQGGERGVVCFGFGGVLLVYCFGEGDVELHLTASSPMCIAFVSTSSSVSQSLRDLKFISSYFAKDGLGSLSPAYISADGFAGLSLQSPVVRHT